LDDLPRAFAGAAGGAVGHRDVRRVQGLEVDEHALEPRLLLGRPRAAHLEGERRALRQQLVDLGHPALRSAISTVLRSSSATVVGPTPPSRGVIHPATSATDSSTSGSSFLPWNTMPPLTTAAPGRTMSGWTMPGTPAAPITMSPWRV